MDRGQFATYSSSAVAVGSSAASHAKHAAGEVVVNGQAVMDSWISVFHVFMADPATSNTIGLCGVIIGGGRLAWDVYHKLRGGDDE